LVVPEVSSPVFEISMSCILVWMYGILKLFKLTLTFICWYGLVPPPTPPPFFFLLLKINLSGNTWSLAFLLLWFEIHFNIERTLFCVFVKLLRLRPTSPFPSFYNHNQLQILLSAWRMTVL
jgi:hypothetical protein